MTRQEVAYFWARTCIITHLVFFLRDVTYFFLIKTQFASEMEIDIMSFSQQGKIECVSIIVQIHNVLLMWKMESKLVHYWVTIIVTILKNFYSHFLQASSYSEDFLWDPNRLKIDKRKALKNPEITTKIFGFRPVNVSNISIVIRLRFHHYKHASR